MKSLAHLKYPINRFALKMAAFSAVFGIYLGRDYRWYCWDIIQNPVSILKDLCLVFWYSEQNLQTWLMTIAYGILLSFIYFGTCQLTLTNRKKS